MREGHWSGLWVVLGLILVALLVSRHELLAGALAVPSPAAVAEPQQFDAAVLELGEEVYLSQCQPCHGNQGKGDGPAAKFLESKPRDLTAGEWESVSEGTASEVAGVVRDGIEGTEMEPFADLLEEDEILAVAAYVIETFVKQSTGS